MKACEKPRRISDRATAVFALIFTAAMVLARLAPASPAGSASSEDDVSGLAVSRAVICEDVVDQQPLHPAIVFSTRLGQVSCFTYFQLVPQKTAIYHKWFHRDEMTTTIKLSLEPPRWSTYSSIQLRSADTGPWRVDVTDDQGKVLCSLRFSIIE